MSNGTFEIRDISYPDIPKVVAIERRAYTSPWSMSMFVLELSKPSGVCLAAANGPELFGYVICSRYDEAYHVMNLAVDPDYHRRGIARALLDGLLERTGHDAAEAIVHPLRGDHVGADLTVGSDDRGTGVVAAGLDREDHVVSHGVPTARHMMIASSPLSA